MVSKISLFGPQGRYPVENGTMEMSIGGFDSSGSTNEGVILVFMRTRFQESWTIIYHSSIAEVILDVLCFILCDIFFEKKITQVRPQKVFYLSQRTIYLSEGGKSNENVK